MKIIELIGIFQQAMLPDDYMLTKALVRRKKNHTEQGPYQQNNEDRQRIRINQNNYGFFVWNLPLKIPTPFWGRQINVGFHDQNTKSLTFFPTFSMVSKICSMFSTLFPGVFPWKTRHHGSECSEKDPAMGENREAL